MAATLRTQSGHRRLKTAAAQPDPEALYRGSQNPAVIHRSRRGANHEATRFHCNIGRRGGMAFGGGRTVRASPADRGVGA